MMKRFAFWKDECYRFGHKMSEPFVFIHQDDSEQKITRQFLGWGIVSHFRKCQSCGMLVFVGNMPSDNLCIPSNVFAHITNRDGYWGEYKYNGGTYDLVRIGALSNFGI